MQSDPGAASALDEARSLTATGVTATGPRALGWRAVSDRRQAAVLGLVIYATASAGALCLVAVSEHLYAGWDAVSPDRLEALLTQPRRP